jgi:hypothetical protein
MDKHRLAGGTANAGTIAPIVRPGRHVIIALDRTPLLGSKSCRNQFKLHSGLV